MKRSILKLTIIGMTVTIFAAAVPRSRGAISLVDEAAAVYKTKCASCHAADGSGNTTVGKSLKIRDLRSAEVQGQTDAQLYALIASGKNKMPPYEKTLGADKCKGLVAFVRSLKGK